MKQSGILVFVLCLVLSGCAVNQSKEDSKQSQRIIQETHRVDVADWKGRELPELTDSSLLSDYLEYAALNNPGLEAAFNRWKAALERVPQVESLPDPRFTYRYFIQEIETRVGPQRQAFEITQMFPWFGKLKLRGNVALEASNAAQQRYEAAKLKLFYEVTDAYYEYYYLARAIAVTQENVNLVKHLERVALTRYKTAAGSHPDIIRSQVELGKLEDRLLTLKDLQEPIVARLNAALNRPIQDPLPWPGKVQLESVSVTDQELLVWLEQGNPELKALSFEIQQQKRSIELAKKDYYPDIALGVGYIDTASTVGPVDPPDDGRDSISAVVSVNIPIWRKKYDAGVQEAKNRYYAAIHTRADKRNSLAAEMKLAWFHFRDAKRKIDLYRDALLPKAKQSLKVTEADFLGGRGMYLDLIDAQRILLEFQLAYERAQANHEQNLAKLEMLVGKKIGK
jgi:outer membrane protein, heavy metal efflux system